MSEICRVLPQLERLPTRQREALSYLMVRVKQAAISAQSVDNAATSEHAIGAQTSIIRRVSKFGASTRLRRRTRVRLRPNPWRRTPRNVQKEPSTRHVHEPGLMAGH
jgi:hypothetical protein